MMVTNATNPPHDQVLPLNDSKPDLAPAVAFHDDLAESWNDKYDKAIFQQRAERFRARLAEIGLGGEKWIDAGCGTGMISRILEEFGANVIGFDASPQMIDVAKRRASGSAKSKFQQIDTIESLPLDTDSIDGIVCSSVIEYLDHPDLAIAEFSRVLRKGGHLIMTVPNKRSFLILIQRFLFAISIRLLEKPFPEYMMHSRNRFSARQLDQLMSDSGFETESIDCTSFWPSTIKLRAFGNMFLYSGRCKA